MTEPILILLELALAIGGPALIALFAPKRWRLGAVGLWAVAPILILVAVGVSEIVSGKASPADLDKLVFGVLLIASIALLPWLMACAAGYALGAVLRRRLRPEAVAARPAPPLREAATPQPLASPAPAAYAPPAEPDAPTLSPPSGWHAAHVGFENDGLVLDGLSVWSLAWRQEPGARVTLAHPAHPTQQHEFDVYKVDDGKRATRFAAAELSNGVWGFYRWVVPANAASAVTADGSLRYEHGAGGRDDNAAPVARLYDARSETLLFDGVAWRSSRIAPQTDGTLLLSVEQGDRETIFHIDPPAGDFRDLAFPASKRRPLAKLAGAAAAARAECDDPANMYVGRRVAPDGSLMVELQWVEWSNSHWVRSPRVTEIATGRVLLDLWGTDWDASPSFPRGRTVRLSFRRYLGGGDMQVEIELSPERYILHEGGGTVFGPLHDLPKALESASRRARRAHPLWATGRSWLVALLILLGALAAIAAGVWITLRLQGEPPPQRLDTIPKMPELPDARPSQPPPPASPSRTAPT